MLAHFLHNQERKLKREAVQTSKFWMAIRKLQFAPVIWIATFVSAASFYWKVVHSGASLAEPLPWMSYMAMLSVLLTGWGVLLMAVLNVSDPGYVRRWGSGQHRGGEGGSLKTLSSVENLDCPAMWAGRWEQLCVTCKIVRPLRAKHEENSGRCIEVGHALCHVA
jgi:palmitoyltransferase ZDHHC13/17